MIFTGSKQKRKKFAISGYSIVIMLFLIACYLNISGSALFAHAILILSIFAFFVMYAALKRGESGILIADNKKLTLSIGFRRVSIELSNIAEIKLGEFKKQTILGVNFKDIAFLPDAVQKIAMISKEQTGFHVCYKGAMFEDDPKNIVKEINELIKQASNKQSK